MLTSGLNETVLRNIPGLHRVLFLPGHALIATLFLSKSNLDRIDNCFFLRAEY
ncbi:MAG: hypothetical protein WB014_00250 [Methanosarcina sp.]